MTTELYGNEINIREIKTKKKEPARNDVMVYLGEEKFLSLGRVTEWGKKRTLDSEDYE